MVTGAGIALKGGPMPSIREQRRHSGARQAVRIGCDVISSPCYRLSGIKPFLMNGRPSLSAIRGQASRMGTRRPFRAVCDVVSSQCSQLSRFKSRLMITRPSLPLPLPVPIPLEAVNELMFQRGRGRRRGRTSGRKLRVRDRMIARVKAARLGRGFALRVQCKVKNAKGKRQNVETRRLHPDILHFAFCILH